MNGFIQSSRPYKKKIAHRDSGERTRPHHVKTVCGVCFSSPVEADIETAEQFCDACLMADYGHVVYTFLDAAGNALYVGQTNNLLKRMQAHGWSSSWFALAVGVRHQIVPAADARRIEAELIAALDPPYNTMGRITDVEAWVEQQASA